MQESLSEIMKMTVNGSGKWQLSLLHLFTSFVTQQLHGPFTATCSH